LRKATASIRSAAVVLGLQAASWPLREEFAYVPWHLTPLAGPKDRGEKQIPPEVSCRPSAPRHHGAPFSFGEEIALSTPLSREMWKSEQLRGGKRRGWLGKT